MVWFRGTAGMGDKSREEVNFQNYFLKIIYNSKSRWHPGIVSLQVRASRMEVDEQGSGQKGHHTTCKPSFSSSSSPLKPFSALLVNWGLVSLVMLVLWVTFRVTSEITTQHPGALCPFQPILCHVHIFLFSVSYFKGAFSYAGDESIHSCCWS